ncbi:MAG: tetratricopeptide repeat protein [Chloroflexi bacterium]|nr:tetratricopeptide repeat protein [Chloroflexota bacterium]
MTSKQETYEHYMNLGHNFAWDQEWDKAVSAYARALQERPEEPDPYKYLGLALIQVKRYNDALKVLMKGHKLAPDDPVPLERSADVLERLGRLKEAAAQYISVAEIYLAQRDIEKAIGNYERATMLTPGLLQIHFRLAQLYERTGRKRAAVLQYLTLAFNFQRNKDRERAMQAIERALRLEPSNVQVLNAKRAIESGELMAVPRLQEERPQDGKPKSGDALAELPAEGAPAASAEAHVAGPLGEATEKALAHLAEYLLEGGLTVAEAQAIQGIELQKMGENAQAVRAFQAAEKQGIRHPALYMCLGSLLVTLGQWQEALQYLERVQDAAYAAGVAHGMGQAYVGLGQVRPAAEQFIRALRLADLQLAINPDEASQLTAVYDELLLAVKQMQDYDLAETCNEFNRWLSGADWKVRIPQTRRAIDDRLRGGGKNELLDIVKDPSIVEALTRVDDYIRRGLYTLAADEAMWIIERQPTSLPAHQRVAQVLMKEGQTQAAITKYNVVINSFLARDDRVSAAMILDEVIKVAPMDVNLRLSLIELLEREGNEARMLDEYISLAGVYYQLAEIDQARDTYLAANRLAQRLNAPIEKRVEILLRLADIYMTRLDWRQAQRTLEQVRDLVPTDDKPRRELVEIHFRLGNPIEAMRELDGLLRVYAQSRRGQLILSTLESMVEAHPNEMGLRSRLAAVYRQLKRIPEAIAQLDALGELQLDAGLIQEACATVRQIISLNPPNVEQYQALLRQIGC